MYLFMTNPQGRVSGHTPKNSSLTLRGETKYIGWEEKVLASTVQILSFSILISHGSMESFALETPSQHSSFIPQCFGLTDIIYSRKIIFSRVRPTIEKQKDG